jgi:hypothetical protein
MIPAIEVLSVVLVAVAMALALAHALELPGKLRLDKPTYIAVQSIYYPGFTLGGMVGEAGGMLATLALLLLTWAQASFGWTLAAFLALVTMQGVYWLITHPVNGFWLRDTPLTGSAARFFSFDPLQRSAAEDASDDGWRSLRARWEYSHVVRAVLAGLSLLSLVTGIALD